MGVVLGMNCKLYFGAAGSTASTLVDNVKDVTLNLETGESDVTTRGNSGWVATVATLKNGSVDCTIVWDTSDAFFTAVQAAWSASSAIALLVLDGVSASGTGLDADFTITNFSRQEPLTEAVTATVTFKPTYSTRAPAWIVEGS